jgi:hypothetical protein
MSERGPPQSTIQAAGQVATDVVAGLRQQPLLLGIVVLNVIGIAAALYFLNKLADASDRRFAMVMQACMPHITIPPTGRPP